MRVVCFSVGAQGFSPAEIPANPRGFSPGLSAKAARRPFPQPV